MLIDLSTLDAIDSYDECGCIDFKKLSNDDVAIYELDLFSLSLDDNQ